MRISENIHIACSNYFNLKSPEVNNPVAKFVLGLLKLITMATGLIPLAVYLAGRVTKSNRPIGTSTTKMQSVTQPHFSSANRLQQEAMRTAQMAKQTQIAGKWQKVREIHQQRQHTEVGRGLQNSREAAGTSWVDRDFESALETTLLDNLFCPSHPVDLIPVLDRIHTMYYSRYVQMPICGWIKELKAALKDPQRAYEVPGLWEKIGKVYVASHTTPIEEASVKVLEVSNWEQRNKNTARGKVRVILDATIIGKLLCPTHPVDLIPLLDAISALYFHPNNPMGFKHPTQNAIQELKEVLKDPRRAAEIPGLWGTIKSSYQAFESQAIEDANERSANAARKGSYPADANRVINEGRLRFELETAYLDTLFCPTQTIDLSPVLDSVGACTYWSFTREDPARQLVADLQEELRPHANTWRCDLKQQTTYVEQLRRGHIDNNRLFICGHTCDLSRISVDILL